MNLEIYINNKRAVLKKGTSFEYIAENRLFSGSDGYTLAISFPLNGCPENIAIFGHINRKDVGTKQSIFDCCLRAGHFRKYGALTIVEINESEIKAQFLEGRSAQNFDETFDNIFINELDLGKQPEKLGSGITPAEAWNPNYNNMEFVALPWVNNASGNIQNLVAYDAENKIYTWDKDTYGLSWQPYLIYIAKKICESRGYSYDFSEWEAAEEYKYILICNTIPFAWDMPETARVLPHWSITEFFEKIELFLEGEFSIDHKSKHIDFKFTKSILAEAQPVQLENIIDEYNTEVSEDDDGCTYRYAKNIGYKQCDNSMWKFYSCDWYIKAFSKDAKNYETLNELLSDNRGFSSWSGSTWRGSNLERLLFAKDLGVYLVYRSLYKTLLEEHTSAPNRYEYSMELRPLNLFGDAIINEKEDSTRTELELVPACIDITDEEYGRLLFLSFQGYEDPEGNNAIGDGKRPGRFGFTPGVTKEELDNRFYQPPTVQTLEAGEKDKKAEFYDCIYIGWWDGSYPHGGKLPHPYTEDLIINEDGTYTELHFNFRLNRKDYQRGHEFLKVDTKVKKTFKFLSDTIPDARSVFFIKGKRYLCEKITATFTERGMSQLLTGVFWPVL